MSNPSPQPPTRSCHSSPYSPQARYVPPPAPLQVVSDLCETVCTCRLSICKKQPCNAKSEYHNKIEQLRDPSHVRLYSEPELVGTLRDAGLKVIHARNWDADFYFDEWVKIADPGEEIAGEVRRMMADSIEGDKIGLRVRVDYEGGLLFTYSTVILVAEKE